MTAKLKNPPSTLTVILTSLPAILLSVAAVVQATRANDQAFETHKTVNSRMTELIEMTKKLATATAMLNAPQKQAVLDSVKAPTKPPAK